MHFPLFMDLSEKEILVVGAGTIAARRIRTLCGFGGHITVRAPGIAEQIRELARCYPLTLEEESFAAGALDGKELVVAATDDHRLNREIASLCRERGILVNVCSEKEECDFYFPSVVQKDGIVIGVNASGQNHGLVKKTRMELERYLSAETRYGDAAGVSGSERENPAGSVVAGDLQKHHWTGIEDLYVMRGQKKLRFGYTTGSCAAAATKGAARLLLAGKVPEQVELMTPKGIRLSLHPEDIQVTEHAVSCAVRKDGGDDPDTTNGILVYARVEKTETPGIVVDGGSGVGRVTKPGLARKIGEAAINPVPHEMILRAAKEEAAGAGYTGGLRVTIFVPDGAEAAKKTFNPRLGIVGGISILGTTGIVEPMSEHALIESIRVEMSQHHAQGESYILATPGNYGADYLREHMDLPFEQNIKCSNYVGETIDMAVNMGVKGILFVAHIGKFVKVAAGIMNTHSHSADARMEVLASNAIRVGAPYDCAAEILNCTTTDEALAVLKRFGALAKAMDELMKRIQFYLNHRSYEQICLGAVVFSNEFGYLGQTEDAGKLIEKIKEESRRETCRENYMESE